MTVFEEYKTLIQNYQSAVRNGDSDALTSLFAEDAMFFGPDQPVLSGRDVIRTEYAENIGDGFPINININDVQDCGAVVYACGEFDYGDGPKKWLQVAKRQDDGSLRIHRLAWN